jgi:hypothetical protein
MILLIVDKPVEIDGFAQSCAASFHGTAKFWGNIYSSVAFHRGNMLME